jgi:hypothetical protein
MFLYFSLKFLYFDADLDGLDSTIVATKNSCWDLANGLFKQITNEKYHPKDYLELKRYC